MESTVIDSFDVKGRTAVDYGANGVIVIFSGVLAREEPHQGTFLLLIRPDGWMARAKIGEVKRHAADGYGVFLPNLTKLDVPVGSRVRWGAEFWHDPNGEITPPRSLVGT